MSSGPLVKDVELLLLSKQKCRRQPGNLPYPLTYCKDLADFDMWDHMFRVSHCKSLTIHPFAKPPPLTLDIGCGSGFWALEAAKQWQNSTIIGFDIVDIQPRLSDIAHLKQLSRRIKWVHGDLLEGLPFPSNHFDFVRIAGMGLAIPEDEWQPVLEEVHRVLKQEGILEIIEEDLIFPTPFSQLQKPQSITSSPTTQSPLPESPVLPQYAKLTNKKSIIFSDKSSERTRVSPDNSTNYIGETSSPVSRSNSKISSLLPLLYTSRQTSSVNLTDSPPICTQSYYELEHPQDHSRLKAAWDAMLATRFLSPNLLSVLPFYLTSASFSVMSHAPVLIPLPPSSGVSPSLKSFQSMGSLRHPDRLGGMMLNLQPTLSIKTDSYSLRTYFSPGLSGLQLPPWATMHLAKVTSIIKGCRDAIWSEYQKLYSEDALDILQKIAPDHGFESDEKYPSQPRECLIHRAFDADWYNWDCDMTDRVGMRKNLLLHSAWAQPTSYEPPCQIWRQQFDKKLDPEKKTVHLITAYNPEDICRSIRTFTARKS